MLTGLSWWEGKEMADFDIALILEIILNGFKNIWTK